MYCAVYEQKPYDVYFEGALCEYFDETDELYSKPKTYWWRYFTTTKGYFFEQYTPYNEIAKNKRRHYL